MGRVISWPCRASVALSLLLVGAVSEGCGKQYVNFEPVGQTAQSSPGWVAKGKYQLPPGLNDVQVEVGARGTLGHTKRGVRYERVHVRLHVKDRGGQPWTLDPSKVRFISDEGREQAGAQAWSGKETLKTVTVLPGGEATFELVMPLPPDTRFRILGSFRLIWPYEYGGKAYETSTKFLKIEEVNYYYPGYSYPYYYPYGPYWGGEWGWDYGPWWGGEEGPEEEFEEHEEGEEHERR